MLAGTTQLCARRLVSRKPGTSNRLLIVGRGEGNHVPEPCYKDSIVRCDNSQAYAKGAGGLPQACIFFFPASGARNNHANAQNRRHANEKADWIIHFVATANPQELPRGSRQQSGGKGHQQPCGWSDHADHIGPTIFHIKQHHQNRQVNYRLIEMEQEEIGLQVGK
jgi:hypothetical protein